MEKRYLPLKITLVSLVTALFCFLLFFALAFPQKYNSEVQAASCEFGVKKELIYAVIWTESKFDKKAQSNKGAKGLMQLMPSTAQWCAEMLAIEYREQELFDPKYNIRLGTFYLSYLIEKHGEHDAIAAYNAGEGNLISWQGEIKFKETKNYVKRVNLLKKIYNFKSK